LRLWGVSAPEPGRKARRLSYLTIPEGRARDRGGIEPGSRRGPGRHASHQATAGQPAGRAQTATGPRDRPPAIHADAGGGDGAQRGPRARGPLGRPLPSTRRPPRKTALREDHVLGDRWAARCRPRGGHRARRRSERTTCSGPRDRPPAIDADAGGGEWPLRATGLSDRPHAIREPRLHPQALSRRQPQIRGILPAPHLLKNLG
jgi:hypothetical protein